MHIYLDREQAKRGTSLVKAVEEEKVENYREKFGENTIEFVGDDLPHFITYLSDTDTIREATESEKLARKQIELKDNEVIIDNVIYTYDKRYQKLVAGKIVGKTLKELVAEGVVTLEEVKFRINEKWKQERQSKVDADLEYKGSVFQMRENIDVKNFEQRGLQIALGQKKLTDREEWRLKDNVFKEFSYEELLQVVGLWGERKKRIWIDLKRMWLELEKATSVEEIEKITWE